MIQQFGHCFRVFKHCRQRQAPPFLCFARTRSFRPLHPSFRIHTQNQPNAAKAGIDAVNADVERTHSELKRQQALIAVKATTHQQLEQAVADADRFAGMLASRQADLARAQAALTSSQSGLEAEKRERAALDTRDSLYEAQIQAKEAAIVVANVNLGYTRIIAPVEGAIGERHVQDGQLVAPGMQVVDLVKGDVWFKRTTKRLSLQISAKAIRPT